MGYYLVTGGCGFIGSHLTAALLSDGHSVRILDDLSLGRAENVSGKVDLQVGSVTDPIAVEAAMADVDGCYHLAAIASLKRTEEDSAWAHCVNVDGTINIFTRAGKDSKNPIPVVYASSAAVYGDSGGKRLSEYDTPKPLSAYGADKLACEQQARLAAVSHDLPTVGLRIFNAYGPGQNLASPYSGVISIFTHKLLDGMPLSIFGDGTQTRDFVFVSDVIRFMKKAMDHVDLEGRVINVCTGTSITLLGLVNTLSAIAGIEATLHYGPPRKDDVGESVGNPEMAKNILGLASDVDLTTGLGHTIDWLDRLELDRPESAN